VAKEFKDPEWMEDKQKRGKGLKVDESLYLLKGVWGSYIVSLVKSGGSRNYSKRPTQQKQERKIPLTKKYSSPNK